MNKQKHDIIATLGPSSEDEAVLLKMLQKGMTIARLNFSWETKEKGARRVELLRKIALQEGREILFIQDLSGPRAQTHDGHHISSESVYSFTEKDREDILFAIEHKCEFVALSYVADAKVIHEVRALLQEYGSTAHIIAKIERKEALDHLEEIVTTSDWVMVARGDLGTAVALEEIPFIQHRIIELCNAKNKPVIVATQMLLSMISHDTPTRAEVSDVAYAILDGADAVMLSEETANGKFPVQAVEVMQSIVSYAQQHASIIIS